MLNWAKFKLYYKIKGGSLDILHLKKWNVILLLLNFTKWEITCKRPLMFWPQLFFKTCYSCSCFYYDFVLKIQVFQKKKVKLTWFNTIAFCFLWKRMSLQAVQFESHVFSIKNSCLLYMCQPLSFDFGQLRELSKPLLWQCLYASG